MSLIKIPDGERTPIYFESIEIVAVREKNDSQTYIFLRGEDDAWIVQCPINLVLAEIPMRFSNTP